MKLDRKGVGALAKVDHPKPMDLSKVKVSASSTREPLVVEARRGGNKNELYANLPDTLPTRMHTFNAINALDNSNFTEWWAAPDDTKKWWQIDLGKEKMLDRCEIFFAHPSLGHAFVVEKSADGKNWQIVHEEKMRAIRSPHAAKEIGKTRFLRVRILEGTPGIWEVKIY